MAVQAAAELFPTFPDGVWVVELASVRDSGQVALAVTEVMDVSDASGRSSTEQLVETLARRRVLILYHGSHLASSDVAIELPIAAGKTLVGMLVAEHAGG